MTMKQNNRFSIKLFSIMLTLAMLLSMLPPLAMATDYPTIALEEEVTVTLNGTDVTEAIYKFVPEKSGEYYFFSYGNDYDTYGHLFDEDMNEIATDDDDGIDYNFLINYNFTEGTTYYLKARFLTTSNSGSFKIKVAAPVPATNIYITEDDHFSIPEGNYIYPEIEYEPVNAVKEDVTWSADNDIVHQDNDVFTFIAPGTVTITATTESGLTDSIVVDVIAATELNLDTEYSIVEEHYYKFTPKENGEYAIYSYNNRNNDKIYLYYKNIDESEYGYGEDFGNGNEIITAELSAGTTYYFEAYSNNSGTSFNVKLEKVVPSTGVHFTSESYSGYYGSKLALNVEFEPSVTSREGFTITSSDPETVSIDGTTAILNKIGNATVTVETDSGLKDTCTVTVTDYPELPLAKDVTVLNDPLNDWNTYYKFTPKTSGTYIFFSSGNYDTYGYIYDSDMNPLAESNDFNKYNFGVVYDLEAGNTYILRAYTYGNYTYGDYTVQINLSDEDGNIVHDVKEYTYTNSDHSGYCVICETDITEPHVFDEDGLCVCGFKHKHNTKYEMYMDYHYGYCMDEFCGAIFDEEHSFDEDGNCVCGYFEHEHLYKRFKVYDETEHASYCTLCLFDNYAPHTPDGNGVCTACGYTDHVHSGNFEIYMDSHNGYCDVCRLNLDGTHSIDDNNRCYCGYIEHTHNFSEYINENESYHIVSCSDCGARDLSTYPHEYDENGVCICGNVMINDVMINDVMIGETAIGDGQYLDCDGNVTDTEPEEWSAYMKDGVLTLRDISVDVNSKSASALYSPTDLKIVLEGNAKFSATDEDCIRIESGDLTIEGEGTLTVVATGGYDGIDAASNGDITINSGTIIVSAGDNGFEAEEKLTVNGGIIVVNAGDDGFDIEDGEINGGAIYIHARDIGIDAVDNTTVNDGVINITANNEDGFEAGGYITVNGGNIVIDANKSGFDSQNNTVSIKGGAIQIRSGEGIVSAYLGIELDPSMGDYDVVLKEIYDSSNDEYRDMYYLVKDGEIVLVATLGDQSAVSENTIASDWITLDSDSFDYTGDAVLPIVTVTDPETGKTLTEGTDYTVTLSVDEAKDIGTYYLIIEGMGDYSGAQYRIFEISDKTVYVGGVLMNNGDYLANGTDSVTNTKPQDGYAYYKNGILELNNYSFNGKSYIYNETYGYSALIYSDYDLTVKLVGKSTLICTSVESDGITSFTDVTISGSGSLDIVSDYGIYSYIGNVTVENGNINIVSNYLAVYTEGEFNIMGGALTITAETPIAMVDLNVSGGIVNINSVYGIDVKNSASFTGGYVNIISEDIAVYGHTDDSIVLSDSVMIAVPENGKIRSFNKMAFVADEDGVAAENITISSNMYGDANCDGNVNLSDASLILKQIANWDVVTNEITSDTNADGNINLSDVSLLLKYIANWDVTLGK